MNLPSLRGREDILGKVDWEMTPQDAIEIFFLKSRGLGSRRLVRHDLEKRYFFCVDNWQDRPRLVLKELAIKSTRIIADIQAPMELLTACVKENGGGKGLYPLNAALRDWLQRELFTNIH